jgi:hypothetical protein
VSLCELTVADGVGIVTVGELTTASRIDDFVRTVAGLVQERDDVRRVTVRTASEDPRGILGRLVQVLDGQARVYGKRVELAP